MLSKKPFGGNKQDFLKLLMGFVRSDVRDHIASQKNDHGPSYRHYRASQRRGMRRTPQRQAFNCSDNWEGKREADIGSARIIGHHEDLTGIYETRIADLALVDLIDLLIPNAAAKPPAAN